MDAKPPDPVKHLEQQVAGAASLIASLALTVAGATNVFLNLSLLVRGQEGNWWPVIPGIILFGVVPTVIGGWMLFRTAKK